MSERRSVDFLDLLIIAMVITSALFFIAFTIRGELRDLQRRVGQLETRK